MRGYRGSVFLPKFCICVLALSTFAACTSRPPLAAEQINAAMEPFTAPDGTLLASEERPRAAFSLAAQTPSTAAGNLLTQENFLTTPGLYNTPDLPASSKHYLLAADLKDLAAGSLVDDSGAKAVKLKADGTNKILLSTESLAPGVYFIRVIGRVNQTDIPRIRRPLYVHLKINDGPNSEQSYYRMRVAYDSAPQEVARIYFNALRDSNSLQAELSLGAGSTEDLLVQALHFHDALPRNTPLAHKTSPGLFTVQERELERQAAKEISLHGAEELDSNGIAWNHNRVWQWFKTPHKPFGLDAAQRKTRDDILWKGMPPLNTMHYAANQVGSKYEFPPEGLTQAEADARYGVWQIDTGSARQDSLAQQLAYDRPWKIINATLGLEYTLDDYIAHKPLPSPWPWADDGFGHYYVFNSINKNPYPSTVQAPGTYYQTISKLLEMRINFQYYGLFDSADGLDLPYRYHLTGDQNAARDASLVLVRFALQWPSLCLESQDLGLVSAIPDLAYNKDYRWTDITYFGKSVYSGWAGPMTEDLVRAYDRLFDFIQGNQELADAVHRYIPWVKNADDVIRLLDTHLLQASVGDVQAVRTRHASIFLIGLVQNPSPEVSSDWMNPQTTEMYVYPLREQSFLKHYHASYNRDGTIYIGSTYYAQVDSSEMFTASDIFRRYALLGGNAPLDLFQNLAQLKKVPAFGQFLLNLTTAGGYLPSVGDASPQPFTPRSPAGAGGLSENVRKTWMFTKDLRAAWLIKFRYGGRTIESDSEWAELEAAAAQTARDPILASESRLLDGFGLAMLEDGVGLDDYRQKRSAVLRLGTGAGHNHYDALDLNFYSLGLRMANDLGNRNQDGMLSFPISAASYVHNLVEVDGYYHPTNASTDSANPWPGGSFTRADAWAETFKPLPGAQYMVGAAKSNGHLNVSAFRREVALIDAGGNQSYLFDVFRVEGGKWHTWSFHGADSGLEPDGFTVNASLTPVSDNLHDSPSAHYLRKHANGRKLEGFSSAKLEATWRLSRTSSTTTECNSDANCQKNIETVPAEQEMLGADYIESAPRKFTKVSLFDHPNEHILVGNAFSTHYKFNFPMLYVQSRQGTSTNYNDLANKSAVYPAIVEAYEGSPLVTSSRSVVLVPNDQTAAKGVLLELQTRTGQSDLVYSGGADITRLGSTVRGQFQVNGRFAFYSENLMGSVNQIELVQGREITVGGGTPSTFSLRPDAALFRTTIASVDYASARITLAESFPLGSPGRCVFHVYNNDHHTSYEATPLNANTLQFSKSAEMGRLEVTAVSANLLTTENDIVLKDIANRDKGFTAVDESGRVLGKLSYNPEGHNYRLQGGVSLASLSDVPDTDGDGERNVYVYDFGAGDTIEAPTHVLLKRIGTDLYSLASDVPVQIALPGSGQLRIRCGTATTFSDIAITPWITGTIAGYVNHVHLGAGTCELKHVR